VSRVLSVVLMGRDTGHPHLLAPNLLTGGKGADLVIRGNVVLNSPNQPNASNCSSSPVRPRSRLQQAAARALVQRRYFRWAGPCKEA
jgi:hypothetical protein